MDGDAHIDESVTAAPSAAAERSHEGAWRVVSVIVMIGIFAYIGHQIYTGILPQGMNLQRLWDPYTKLRPFEHKITDVGSEFVRRSPLLRELVAEYGRCQPKCPDSLYERRDEVIRQDWPEVFARLRIKDDWSEAMQNKSWSYDQVGRINDDYKSLAPIMCIPKFRFSYTKATGPYTYFEKFVCLPP